MQLRLEDAGLFPQEFDEIALFSIQPTNAAMINGSGSTHGVYAKAASVELSEITGTRRPRRSEHRAAARRLWDP